MAGILAKTIIVPVDFSDVSMQAVDVALEIAEKPSDVHVIHVLHELHASQPGVIWDTIDHDQRCRHAETSLRNELTEAKYDEIKLRVDIGDAGHRVAEYAEEVGADLVVLPSHGRRGFVRLLLGSVAERILRLAHCPVLVLRQ